MGCGRVPRSGSRAFQAFPQQSSCRVASGGDRQAAMRFSRLRRPAYGLRRATPSGMASFHVSLGAPIAGESHTLQKPLRRCRAARGRVCDSHRGRGSRLLSAGRLCRRSSRWPNGSGIGRWFWDRSHSRSRRSDGAGWSREHDCECRSRRKCRFRWESGDEYGWSSHHVRRTRRWRDIEWRSLDDRGRCGNVEQHRRLSESAHARDARRNERKLGQLRYDWRGLLLRRGELQPMGLLESRRQNGYNQRNARDVWWRAAGSHRRRLLLRLWCQF